MIFRQNLVHPWRRAAHAREAEEPNLHRVQLNDDRAGVGPSEIGCKRPVHVAGGVGPYLYVRQTKIGRPAFR